MKNEFKEAYTCLFENSFTNLRRTIQVKLKAIRYSNKYLLKFTKNGPSFKSFGNLNCAEEDMQKKLASFNFEPID